MPCTVPHASGAIHGLGFGTFYHKREGLLEIPRFGL